MEQKQYIFGRVFWKYRPKCFSDEQSESENFRSYLQKSRLECYFVSLFWTFEVRFCGSPTPFDSQEQEDQKCPEKQDKKSKRDMKSSCIALAKLILKIKKAFVGFLKIIYQKTSSFRCTFFKADGYKDKILLHPNYFILKPNLYILFCIYNYK